MRNKLKKSLKNNKWLFVFIIVINIIIYTLVFVVIDTNKTKAVDTLLKQEIQNIKNHYYVTVNQYRLITQNTLEFIHKDKELLQILEKFLTASEQEQFELRAKLYEKLEDHYKKIQKYGVLQFHFVSPKNITVLRMHKPEKYNDDLTDMKYTFRYVNDTKNPISGLEEGKTSVGFRDVNPLFGENNIYLGCVDIAFSPEKVQKSLFELSNIYSNLIFHKSIIHIKEWHRDDLQIVYEDSVEHPDYYEHIYRQHSEGFEELVIGDNQEKVRANIEKNIEFAVNSQVDGHMYIAAFLPLKNVENRVIGYLVSYTLSPSLGAVYTNFYIVNMILVILMMLFSFYIYRIMLSKNKIEVLSLYDNLTCLPNRLLLQKTLIRSIANAKRHNKKFAVLFIDLDHFKPINDTYGHDIGDAVLLAVSKRMKDLVREEDILARLGGDEFVCVVQELKSSENGAQVAKKIIDALNEPIVVNDFEHCVGASIGISIFPDNATNVLDLLKYADMAMYNVKENGKNNVALYSV